MGTEFRVNSYQSNWQDESHVLALRDGGFLVTWSSYFNEYDDTDLRTNYVAAQFYDANAMPVGGETILRAIEEGSSDAPRATQLKNGNIVVTWSEATNDPILTNDTYIAARIFDTSGQAVSDVIYVDTVKSNDAVYPEVVATGSGGFVVSFGAETGRKNFDEVYYRSYDANGQALGKDKVLNTRSNDFDELVSKGAELSNGNSVVIWNSEAAISDGTNDGRNQIRASLFNDDGKVIKSDFGLTPHFGGAGGFWSDSENYGYAVAAGKKGGFAVANLDWTPGNNAKNGAMSIFFSAYNASGKEIIDAFPIFKKGSVMGDLDMARLSNGQYVVAWSQQSLKNSDVGDDAYALVLSAKGKPIGNVMTVGIDASKYDDQTEVSVAALKKGAFVITYSSEAIDADDEGIAATYYAPGGKGNGYQKVEGQEAVTKRLGNETQAKAITVAEGGADSFVFVGKPANGVAIDGDDNRIELDHRLFEGLDIGALDRSDFVTGKAATGVDAQLVYDRETGELNFDADGKGAADPVLIAKLAAGMELSAADIWVA